MRVNKKVQYGLLFALYLARAGRATTGNAAKNLKLSKSFLEQVARQLRLHNVVKSVRGPSGGYELIGEPVVGAVFAALAPLQIITDKQLLKLKSGTAEQRALARFLKSMNIGLSTYMCKKVRDLNTDLVQYEMVLIESCVQPECGAV